MAQRGGKRAGAGRKASPTVKRQRDTKALVAKALARGDITPLEVMLETMQKAYEAGGALAAFPDAKEIAPYLHPKRQQVDAKGSSDITIERLIFSGAPVANDEALAEVIHISVGSQV